MADSILDRDVPFGPLQGLSSDGHAFAVLPGLPQDSIIETAQAYLNNSFEVLKLMHGFNAGEITVEHLLALEALLTPVSALLESLARSVVEENQP